MTVVLATELPGAGGGLACAAALAVAIAAEQAPGEGTLLVDAGGEHARGPTMLASRGARELETRLGEAGLPASARGRLCWLRLAPGADGPEELSRALDAAGADAAIVHLPPPRWREAVEHPAVAAPGALIRAELPAQRPLAALVVRELREAGVAVRVATRAPGRVGARRALAGIDPGGDTARRLRRLARGLVPGPPHRGTAPRGAEAGQALPLALGAAFVLVFATLVLAALGGAVTGKSRAQRAADLVALSAARSMRDDFDRLFAPPRLPNGAPNPGHLGKDRYLERARAAAVEAARRNGVAPDRLQLEFPDSGSFAPLRARVEVAATTALPGPDPRVEVHAEAAAVPPTAASSDPAPPAAAPSASGGGYSGPLVYRQGEPSRTF